MMTNNNIKIKREAPWVEASNFVKLGGMLKRNVVLKQRNWEFVLKWYKSNTFFFNCIKFSVCVVNFFRFVPLSYETEIIITLNKNGKQDTIEPCVSGAGC